MSVQYSKNVNERYTTEFKNVHRELLEWLEKTSLENNYRIDKKEWKSKYNSYVVYDYEPFCSDGFEINMTISSYDINYVNFLKFLFENKVKTIDTLFCLLLNKNTYTRAVVSCWIFIKRCGCLQ